MMILYIMKLYNFVYSLSYCFVEQQDSIILVYEVSTRRNSVYKEVSFAGKVLWLGASDSEFDFSTEELAGRRKKYLGY